MQRGILLAWPFTYLIGCVDHVIEKDEQLATLMEYNNIEKIGRSVSEQIGRWTSEQTNMRIIQQMKKGTLDCIKTSGVGDMQAMSSSFNELLFIVFGPIFIECVQTMLLNFISLNVTKFGF